MSSAEAHSHAEGTCPVTGKHGWCPAQAGDSRCPCPALNTLANHGYLPRDGKNISSFTLTKALMEGYGLSAPLGYLLGYGAIVLMRKMPPFDLYDFAEHGGIEHNASLYHDDADGEKYAPVFANEEKLEDFLSKLPAKIRAEDIAAVRVAKEDAYETSPLDALHGEIARGEVSISLGVFTEKGKEAEGVPLERFREWLSKERFPEGWTPHHVHGLLETVMTARDIRLGMEKIRKEKKETKKAA